MKWKSANAFIFDFNVLIDQLLRKWRLIQILNVELVEQALR